MPCQLPSLHAVLEPLLWPNTPPVRSYRSLHTPKEDPRPSTVLQPTPAVGNFGLRWVLLTPAPPLPDWCDCSAGLQGRSQPGLTSPLQYRSARVTSAQASPFPVRSCSSLNPEPAASIASRWNQVAQRGAKRSTSLSTGRARFFGMAPSSSSAILLIAPTLVMSGSFSEVLRAGRSRTR